MTEVAAEDDDSQKRDEDYNRRLKDSLDGSKDEIKNAANVGASRALSWFSKENERIANDVASYLREEGYTVKVDKEDKASGSVSLWIDVPKPEDS